MPRLIHSNPSYRKHRPSGQAVVTLDGRDFYLGPWQSKASRQEYDRLTGEWLANGRRLPRSAGNGEADLSIEELIDRFWAHAQKYYRHPDGTPTGEAANFKYALAILNRLYGNTVARDFGPLALESVRGKMIEAGWCRTNVNHNIDRVRQVFKWGVSKEVVPSSVHQSLTTLAPLRAGRTHARESEPVKPVPDATVDATLPFLSPTVAAMVQLQRLTGARPGEICRMRTGDIDRTGNVWTYAPAVHKTQHRGKAHSIYIGPKAQAVLTPYLILDPAAYCFSPAAAELQRRDALHAARKTPLNCGNCPGSNVTRRPVRSPGARYITGAYRRAIARGCELAFPPPPALAKLPDESVRAWKNRLTAEQRVELRQWFRQHCWHPHRLRHTAATAIRKSFGMEAARVTLDQADAGTTAVYAERDAALARQVAAAIG